MSLFDDLNLNVNDYEIPELIDLFDITVSYNQLTEQIVNSAVEARISQYKQLSGKTNNEDQYIVFFRRAEAKLQEYVKIFCSSYSNSNSNSNHQHSNRNNNLHNNTPPSSNTLIGGDHLVIKKPEYPFQTTFSVEYPNGVMNPVEKKTIKKVINIDTLFRQRYNATTASDFTCVLPNPVSNVVSMKLTSVELPSMWYVYSNRKQNNQFMIYLYNVNDGTGSFYDISFNVVLPEGNYLADEYNIAINNFFINTGNGLDFLTTGVNPYSGRCYIRTRSIFDTSSNFPIPFDPTNAYYSPDFFYVLDFNLTDNPSYAEPPPPPNPATIACYNDAFQRTHMKLSNLHVNKYNTPVDPRILPYDYAEMQQQTVKLRPLYKNLGWMLGFRKDFYVVERSNTHVDGMTFPEAKATYEGYIETEAAYGGSVQQYVFIEVDDYNSNFVTDSITSATGTSYLGKNIIAKMPIVNSHYNIIYNNPSDRIFKQRDYFGPVNIEKLHIRLLDRFGDPIDINNTDYSLAIELTCLY